MKLLSLLLILNTLLWSTNLTKYKISESEDRVDIMLYFDTPYNQEIIKKQESDSTLLIILPQMNSQYKIANHINSPIIQSFKAISYKNKTMIELRGVDKFKIEALSTIDNYGMRLRVKPLLVTNAKLYPTKKKSNQFKTKDDSDIASASIKVLLALFWVFAALFLLKTWIMKNRDEEIKMPKWLSKKQETKKTTPKKDKKATEVIIEIKEEKPKEVPKVEEKPKEVPKVVEKPKEVPKAPEKPKEVPKAPEKPKEVPKAPEKPKEVPKVVEKPKEVLKVVEKQPIKTLEQPKTSPTPDPFNIVFQKHIDKQNTVSLLEYNGNSYLILTGNTNMLLEMNAKTQTRVPIQDQDIQNLLEQNDKNFNEFIQLQNIKYNEYNRNAPIKIGASS